MESHRLIRIVVEVVTVLCKSIAETSYKFSGYNNVMKFEKKIEQVKLINARVFFWNLIGGWVFDLENICNICMYYALLRDVCLILLQ